MYDHTKRFLFLTLFAALAVVSTASAGVSGGLPPQLGKLCGSVNGAAWKFQGHSGTHYSVVAKTAAMCSAGMKSVGALTRQTPHAGAVGPHTLKGPRGFQCLITLPAAHSGYCGGTGSNAVFYWAPRLKG